MSSPNLNNIIILGCMLCYTSVVLLGLDARILSSDEYGTNCNVRYNFLWFVLKKLPNDYRSTKDKKHLDSHKKTQQFISLHVGAAAFCSAKRACKAKHGLILHTYEIRGDDLLNCLM